MQFTTSCITAILAFTPFATASPLQARQATLQDFQVTSVGVQTPSGRPGSYPWATITAAVTDPNEINLGNSSSDGSQVIVPAGSQGVNCKAQWFTKGESPVGRTWPCDAVENGYWTLQVLSSAANAVNYNLKFTHVADVLYRGSQYTASFTAEGRFAVGDNLSGQCGGSGACGWGLTTKPVLIPATKV